MQWRRKRRKKDFSTGFWPLRPALVLGSCMQFPLGSSVQYCHTSSWWVGEQTQELRERTSNFAPCNLSLLLLQTGMQHLPAALPMLLPSFPALPFSRQWWALPGYPHPWPPVLLLFTQHLIAGYVMVHRHWIMVNLVFLVWQISSLL